MLSAVTAVVAMVAFVAVVAVAAFPVVFAAIVPGSRAEASVPDAILLAFVVSVVAEGASPEISVAAGCAWAGTPEVEIEVKKLCAT